MSNSTKIILDLIKERKTTKAQLERECGLSNGTIHNWEKGRNNPSYGAIVKIAKFFSVSEDYIMGNVDKKAAPQEQPLSEKQETVLRLSEQLTDEDLKKLIDYAELLRKAKNQ